MLLCYETKHKNKKDYSYYTIIKDYTNLSDARATKENVLFQ